MIRWCMAVLGATCVACGAGAENGDTNIGSAHVNDTEDHVYDRTFTFDSPVHCSPFVEQRIVDGDVAEYDARVAPGRETIQATYSVVPNDPYPVHIAVSHGAQGEALFSVTLGPHDLRVLGADGTVALSVDGYDQGSASATPGTWTDPTSGADPAVFSDAMSVLQCMLPVQTALGAIPAFFENRSEQPGKGGVVGMANDAPPLVPSWDGTRTFFGAFFTVAVCLAPTAEGLSWYCACPTSVVGNALIGIDLGNLCATPWSRPAPAHGTPLSW